MKTKVGGYLFLIGLGAICASIGHLWYDSYSGIILVVILYSILILVGILLFYFEPVPPTQQERKKEQAQPAPVVPQAGIEELKKMSKQIEEKLSPYVHYANIAQAEHKSYYYKNSATTKAIELLSYRAAYAKLRSGYKPEKVSAGLEEDLSLLQKIEASPLDESCNLETKLHDLRLNYERLYKNRLDNPPKEKVLKCVSCHTPIEACPKCGGEIRKTKQ